MILFEPVREKKKTNKQTIIWVSTRSEPGCTVTEDGWRLEILDLESKELYYPCIETKDADQLRSYCEADLRFCFRLCRLLVFPCGRSFILSFFFSSIIIRETRTESDGVANIVSLVRDDDVDVIFGPPSSLGKS